MSRHLRILYIDPNYQITYFILRSPFSVRTSVPLQEAIELLEKEDFDLIISEPHNRVIVKEQDHSLKSGPIMSDERIMMGTEHDDLREIKSHLYS